MSRSIRYVLLCEDRLHERFLRQVFQRLGFVEVRVACQSIVPGNASRGVISQYPKEVRYLRSKSYQRDLTLFVVIDGDQDGPRARKIQLADALSNHGIPNRAKDERIVIAVPTWSIETWLGSFNGHPDLDERTKYKRASWFPNERKDLTLWIRRAADSFVDLLKKTTTKESFLPSIQDAAMEFQRLSS